MPEEEVWILPGFGGMYDQCVGPNAGNSQAGWICCQREINVATLERAGRKRPHLSVIGRTICTHRGRSGASVSIELRGGCEILAGFQGVVGTPVCIRRVYKIREAILPSLVS